MEDRLLLLERTVAQLSGHDIDQAESQLHEETQEEDVTELRHGSAVEEQQGWEVVVDDNNAPAAIPASYISEIPASPLQNHARNSHQKQPDMISRKILHIQSATSLFELYRHRLNPFLYGILGDFSTLADVRRVSPLLTDALCTVSALHSESENYPACRAAFMQQVSTQMFSKRKTPDDVRALCIGAFWLSDISWSLMGLGKKSMPLYWFLLTHASAVCIANEINLNYALVRPNYASRVAYLNARLYLLVHICDRHLSIVYGRAPMSETFHDLTFIKDFLKSPHICEDDRRLASQLELWSISYRTYRTFGLDTESALPQTYMGDFRRICIALDTWRVDWEEKFAQDTGNYVKHGIGLHFDFAKLYLCSHAYRGLLNGQNATSASDLGLEEFAANAVNAAESILKTITSSAEIQTLLRSLPAYFDTMIAFAVVFLLKAVAKPQQGLRIERRRTINLLEHLSHTLIDVTSHMRREHILCGIAQSVQKLIKKASAAFLAETTPMQQPTIPTTGLVENDFGWLVSPDDSPFFENFDLTGLAQDFHFDLMEGNSIS